MSFPRYPEYKDSGVEWLGEVPGHWAVLPLKRRIARIESGTSVNAIDVPASDGEFGVLKTSCVYTGEFDANENKAIVPQEYGRATCPLRSGALIVSRMNTPDLVGAAGLVHEGSERIFLPDRLWQIQFSELDPRFVHRWTQSGLYRAQVQMACAGTSASMQNLAQDQFGAFLLAAPPAGEQAAIATFLDRETAKIDSLVAEQEKLIALLQEKRQAVISHAVTKGLDPDAPMKDTGVEWLGEVPAHWELVRLKRAVMFQRGHDLPEESRSEGEVPVVSSAGVIGTHDTAQAKGPGIVTGRYGSIGRFTLVEEDYWPLNTALYSIELYNNQPRYIWYLLQSTTEHFVLNSLKSAVPGVDRSDIHVVQVAVPARREQAAIAAFLDEETAKTDALVAEAVHAIDLLKERRAAIISAAVTGQIDLRRLALEPA